jgi:anthranilate phosphoribosyltransferase
MSIQAKILVVNLAAALAAACKCTVIMHGNARILAMQEM